MNNIYKVDLCEIENMLQSIDETSNMLKRDSFEINDIILNMDDAVYSGPDADALRGGMNKMTGQVIPIMADNYDITKRFLIAYYEKLKDNKRFANSFGIDLGVDSTGSTSGLTRCDFTATEMAMSNCSAIEQMCYEIGLSIDTIQDLASSLRHEDASGIRSATNRFEQQNTKIMNFMSTNRSNLNTYASNYMMADDAFYNDLANFCNSLSHNPAAKVQLKGAFRGFASIGTLKSINRNGYGSLYSSSSDNQIGTLDDDEAENGQVDAMVLIQAIMHLLSKDTLTDAERALLESYYKKIEMYNLEQRLALYYANRCAHVARYDKLFVRSQEIDFMARLWIWGVQLNDQIIMQKVIGYMATRLNVRALMLSCIDPEKNGKAYYTWARIIKTTIPDNSKWTVFSNAAKLGSFYVGIKGEDGNWLILFEAFDMNQIIGQDTINYLKNDLGLSKMDVAAMLSCFGDNFAEDVHNIKELLSIKECDVQSYKKFFENCYITDMTSRLLSLYLYDVVDWENSGFDRATSYVNGLLAVERATNGDDKSVGLLNIIYNEIYPMHQAAIMVALQDDVTENVNKVFRLEYMGTAIASIYNVLTSDVYVYNPKNCMVQNWFYDKYTDTGSMKFLHTTCDVEYVEAITFNKENSDIQETEASSAEWLELKKAASISSKSIQVARDIFKTGMGLITTPIKAGWNLTIGTVYSLYDGAKSVIRDATYNPSDEIVQLETNYLTRMFGVQYSASYSKAEDGPSYMMERYALNGEKELSFVGFSSEMSYEGALLYKQIYEEGTRSIAPLEVPEGFTASSNEADLDIAYFENRLDEFANNMVGETKAYIIANREILCKIYSGGFDLYGYIEEHRNGGDWTQLTKLFKKYQLIMGDNNDIFFVKDELDEIY